METRDFKGIWIPKEIWLNKDLSMMEKLFLVEIDSLDNADGCFASNAYFADFFGLSKGRCTQIIKELEAKGIITIEHETQGNLITKRTLRVVNKLNGVFRKLNGGSEKTKQGYLENDEENNTLINNTSNNTEKEDICASDGCTHENPSSTDMVEEIYNSYIPGRKIKPQLSKKRIKALIAKHGEEKVKRAVARYKQAVAGSELQYIKHSDGFFQEDYITKYLADDYTGPPKSKSANITPFNDYDGQRSYDYQALERRMLGMEDDQ